MRGGGRGEKHLSFFRGWFIMAQKRRLIVNKGFYLVFHTLSRSSSGVEQFIRNE